MTDRKPSSYIAPNEPDTDEKIIGALDELHAAVFPPTDLPKQESTEWRSMPCTNCQRPNAPCKPEFCPSCGGTLEVPYRESSTPQKLPESIRNGTSNWDATLPAASLEDKAREAAEKSNKSVEQFRQQYGLAA